MTKIDRRDFMNVGLIAAGFGCITASHYLEQRATEQKESEERSKIRSSARHIIESKEDEAAEAK